MKSQPVTNFLLSATMLLLGLLWPFTDVSPQASVAVGCRSRGEFGSNAADTRTSASWVPIQTAGFICFMAGECDGAASAMRVAGFRGFKRTSDLSLP